MYFKENRQSMTEKGPSSGRVDNFQTGHREKEETYEHSHSTG